MPLPLHLAHCLQMREFIGFYAEWAEGLIS